MQPYFFPYIGYFQLIHHVDQWIVFDDVQFIKQGWINRNRILHPTEGWQYITVPLAKHSYKDLIKDIRISHINTWKTKLLNQLYHYHKKAPFSTKCIHLVEKALEVNTNSITKLNIHILEEVCSYLEIPFSYQISSEKRFDYNNVNTAEERIIAICKQLQANEYVNPIGGRELYNTQVFQQAGIELSFLQSNINQLYYQQNNRPFEPGLSIIDALMFCSKEEIQSMLHKYEVL